MGIIKEAIMNEPDKIIQCQVTGTTEETCQFHGKYTAYHSQYGISGCPICDDEEHRKQLKEIIENHDRNKAREVFKRSCVPSKYTRSTFGDFVPSCHEAANMKKKLGQYVMRFDEALKQGVSYLISGGTGTGKTLLSTAVLNNIMHRGYTGIYVSTIDFLLRVKRAWSAKSDLTVDEIIQNYVDNFDLLVLDDILKGKVTSNDKAMIFALLDRRNQEDKPTIGISIFSEAAISSKLDPDVIRRLHNGGGETLNFSWKGFEKTREKFL